MGRHELKRTVFYHYEVLVLCHFFFKSSGSCLIKKEKSSDWAFTDFFFFFSISISSRALIVTKIVQREKILVPFWSGGFDSECKEMENLRASDHLDKTMFGL